MKVSKQITKTVQTTSYDFQRIFKGTENKWVQRDVFGSNSGKSKINGLCSAQQPVLLLNVFI